LLSACIIALIFSLAILLPNKPDLNPAKPQGMVHYTRSGQYINGTESWAITEIDPAFFSHLSNYTFIRLEIYGIMPDGNVGSVYINEHFVGTANASQRFNEWNVPVGFCDVTTVIKVVSGGWDVQSVDLLFFVEFSQVPPWWKQNVLIIFLVFFAEIIIAVLIFRKLMKWRKTKLKI
jgi:hypothetical protein